MSMENERFVKVTDKGKQYTTYADMARLLDLKHFLMNCSVHEGEVYKVITSCKIVDDLPCKHAGKTFLGIKSLNDGSEHIITNDGVIPGVV